MAKEEAERPIDAELTKIIFSNSFEFIRATTQILQGLTSLLLTSYIALLVAFCKDNGLHGFGTVAVAFLPVVLFAGSLTIAFVQAVTYKGADITFDEAGNPVGAITTYETIAAARRGHLLWPAILTAIGIIAFIWSFFAVFIPAAELGKRDQARQGAVSCNGHCQPNCQAAAPSSPIVIVVREPESKASCNSSGPENPKPATSPASSCSCVQGNSAPPGKANPKCKGCSRR
jgi:hypothetical protein